MSPNNLSFIDVSFSYDSSLEPIIKNASFSLSYGWTGIIGPNGIGKSTLAKIAGFFFDKFIVVYLLYL